MATKSKTAVIIGSGAGGSMAALALAQSGRFDRITVLEKGPNYYEGLDRPNFNEMTVAFSNDEIKFGQRAGAGAAPDSLDDPDLNVRQSWTLTRVDVDTNQETVLGTGRVAPYFVGPTSMPDYATLAQSAIQTLPGGYKVFVGPRDDPFFVDLAATFDLLSLRPGASRSAKEFGAAFERSGLRGDRRDANIAVDGVGGYNVMSIVLQIPKKRIRQQTARSQC